MLLQKVRFPSVLWPGSFPLCKCTHLLMGSFRILAVVNSAAMNIEVLMFFELVFRVSLNIFPEVG